MGETPAEVGERYARAGDLVVRAAPVMIHIMWIMKVSRRPALSMELL